MNGSRRTKEGVTHVYDKNGKVLSEGEEVVKRWKEHFEGLYQEMDGPGLHMPNGVTTVLEGDLEIMKEEVRSVLRRLKMRKAPGICGIVPEMLKAGGEVMVVCMDGEDVQSGVERRGGPRRLDKGSNYTYFQERQQIRLCKLQGNKSIERCWQGVWADTG